MTPCAHKGKNETPKPVRAREDCKREFEVFWREGGQGGSQNRKKCRENVRGYYSKCRGESLALPTMDWLYFFQCPELSHKTALKDTQKTLN
jgi:hypothetical protein